MEGFEGFHLSMQPIEEAKVVDLSTGETVSRPDIAQRAADVMGEAIEQAGGTLSIGYLEDEINSIDINDLGEDKI